MPSAPGIAKAVRGDATKRFTFHRQKRNSTEGDQVPGQQLTAAEKQLQSLLSEASIDIGRNPDEGIRKLAWNGIPGRHRADVWRLLCGYALPLAERSAKELVRKRREYYEYISLYFERHSLKPGSEVVTHEQKILRQLELDLPRHSMAVFHDVGFCKRLERMLFIWSLRHPAVGYVQGMDDIVLLFYLVFLGARCHGKAADVATNDIHRLQSATQHLTKEELDEVEADTYWCGGRMLSWVQDHFTFSQPGVQKLVIKLETLVEAVDAPLLAHLTEIGISFMQFAFQWIHCLLVRELPPVLAMRLWDTYLSEGERFAEFHVYVCCALLCHWSAEIRMMPMEQAIRHLQSPPTHGMSLPWIDTIISHAYLLKTKHPLDTPATPAKK